MKIKKIMLENFRSFKGKHEIEFAPINLFFGANSVGKSSIFKALNNFNNLQHDDIFIGESFSSVSLTFAAYSKPTLDKNKNLFVLKPRIDLLKVIEEEEWALDFFRNFQLIAKSFFIKKELKVEVRNDKDWVDYQRYGVNDIWFFELSEGRNEKNYKDWKFNKISINLEHPILKSHPFLKLESSKRSFEILNKCFERLDGQDKGYAPYLLRKLIQHKNSLNLDLEQDLDLFMNIIQEYIEDKLDDNYKYLHKYITVLVWVLSEIYNAMPNLNELVHLGPLRKVPEIVMDEPGANEFEALIIEEEKRLRQKPLTSSNYTGESAWKDIFYSHKYGRDVEQFPGLDDEGMSLEEKVNIWLLDWFNTPYEIQFHRKFVFTSDTAEKLQKFNSGQLNIEDLSSESARVVFKNIQNGSVSPASEIGVGISQLTPVIVNTLRSQSFFVEQPELHVHPRMQTVLGDLFVFEGLFKAAKDTGEVTITTQNLDGQKQERHFNRKNEKQESFILVETHSEHLILRLLKRLREGILQPEDLAIYYFENDNGKSISNRIGVDSDGEFTTSWPEGFFEERLEELF